MSRLVSVVMPAYNCEAYIGQAISSVLQQTYKNIELIIVDDFSTDNTQLVVDGFLYDERVKYYKLDSNSGSPAAPRNFGINKVSGEFVTFLDSDDCWEINKVELQLEFMIQKCIDFSCTSYNIVDDNSVLLSKYTPPMHFGYQDLLLNNSVGCSTVMLSAALAKRYTFPRCGHEDFALWLQITRNEGLIIHSIPLFLSNYRKVKGSVSSNKLGVISFYWNIYRNCESKSVFESIIYCFLYFINVVFFKYK